MKAQNKTKLLGIIERYFTHEYLTIDDNGERHDFGKKPYDQHADLQIKDQAFYTVVCNKGCIGFAEAFHQGLCDTTNLELLLSTFCRNIALAKALDAMMPLYYKTALWWHRKSHRNTTKKSRKHIMAHYDLGHDLFSKLLCSRMVYSSATFTDPNQSLEEASENKLRGICEKLQLDQHDRVLEIGSGWGGLAVYMAQQHGCHVTTTTISEDQYQYVAKLIERHNLDSKITLLKKDYRDLDGQFSKIVSIEMIEAVGKKYLKRFIQQCDQLLAPGGLCFIQAICIRDQAYAQYQKQVDFIQRYIFPGGFLPCLHALLSLCKSHTTLQLSHLDNIASDYSLTLKAWQRNLINNQEDLAQQGYDALFIRQWQYYLCYCMAGFNTNRTATYQMLFQK